MKSNEQLNSLSRTKLVVGQGGAIYRRHQPEQRRQVAKLNQGTLLQIYMTPPIKRHESGDLRAGGEHNPGKENAEIRPLSEDGL
jgi:hypothetical protein